MSALSALSRPLAPLTGAGLGLLSRLRLPQTTGRLSLAGLEAPVEIIRDRWGVPHIYAQNHHDLMYAQGFVHGQDRLWQMDFNRRLVSGRLAEVLGAAALPVDRWMRTIGMRRAAEQDVAVISAGTYAELEAYAAGVNAYVAQGPLPVECALLRYQPGPWMVADTLSWVKMMSWSLSVNWETEMLRAQLIARLGEDLAAQLEVPYLDRWPLILPGGRGRTVGGDAAADGDAGPLFGAGSAALDSAKAGRPFTGPPANAGLGSNNWVIAGAHTASGKPLLANDMHLLLSAPAIWYENHLSDGTCNIAGVTFPGLPGIVAGHNNYVAWGFTNGFPDVEDLFIEHLRRTAEGRVQYEFRGAWLDAQVFHEEIRVKGELPVVEEVVVTGHGPIINSLAAGELGTEQPLALRWTSLDPDSIIEGLRAINCAQNCLELHEAFRFWTAPVQNVVYADVEGNIGFTHAGKIPIRAKGDGQVPVPGWTGEYEWTGYIPYDELPHLYNPPEGYIVTANNRVAPDGYPHFLGREYCQGDRAERITELLQARLAQKIDVAYVQHMQFDQVSPSARFVAHSLAGLAPGAPAAADGDEPDLAAAIELMRAWDGRLAPDSQAAAIYEVFMRCMLTTMLSSKLGDLTVRYMGKGPTPILAEASLYGERAFEWVQGILARPAAPWFDGAAGRDAAMRAALRQALRYLQGTLGPRRENWSWGRLHKLTFGHMLGRNGTLGAFFNRGPYPIGGDGSTIWASGSSYHDLDSPHVVGPPFRFIADLSDLNNSVSMLAPGQSGNPASPHYDDQVDAWFTGAYHPLLCERRAVELAGRATLWLEPPG